MADVSELHLVTGMDQLAAWSDLSYFMADNLHLVSNERGNHNLVHEGRVYNLKHTNMEDKHWVCRRVKKGCRGSMHTNLDVN
ncbi:hypothetical protein T11_7987 [Trichinella zimbabwensis]|uniref:FLYWCH-type domain-containing protein n=1 Tax=Trichinella zimbabwensis TaxID=268475 RepID=A0A0V1HV01_9BILA|nr:hypothetical protein T11_7987 [Trichinella zimbabwensis]